MQKAIFCDLQVEIVFAGHILGGCFGDRAGVQQYISCKIDMWVRCVELLAGTTRSYLQLAYAAFIHSFLCKWSYLQQVVESCDKEYCHLGDGIHQVFSPDVRGRNVVNVKHILFELPIKLGGIALNDLVKSSSFSFSTSKTATSVIQEAVQMGNEIAITDHITHCHAVKKEGFKRKEEAQQQLST